MKSTGIGPRRVMNALRYSLDGIAGAWRAEMSFRQEVLAAIVLLPTACLLPIPPLHRVALAVVVLQVLMVELLNSSIEAIVDRASPEIHPLAKQAKDAGSAAVFFSVIIATITWVAVLATWLAP